SVPSSPVKVQVAGSGESAVLVREQYDVVLEHDRQVGDFLRDHTTVRLPVVTNKVRIAPERQKRSSAESRQRTFGTRDAARRTRLHGVLHRGRTQVVAVKAFCLRSPLPFLAALASHDCLCCLPRTTQYMAVVRMGTTRY